MAGPGAPLPPMAVEVARAGFGTDLSGIRVHTGTGADRAATGLHARAFTTGSHIAFRAGAFAPGTATGDRLLAHELAHVLQQHDGVARAPIDTGRSDPLEQAADVTAGRLLALAGSRGLGPAPAATSASGAAPGPAPATSSMVVQRSWEEDLGESIGKDLDAYLATHPKDGAAHLVEVMRWLSAKYPDAEDNVAAEFITRQSDDQMEALAEGSRRSTRAKVRQCRRVLYSSMHDERRPGPHRRTDRARRVRARPDTGRSCTYTAADSRTIVVNSFEQPGWAGDPGPGIGAGDLRRERSRRAKTVWRRASSTLRPPKLRGGLAGDARFDDLPAVGQHREVRQPDVDPERETRQREADGLRRGRQTRRDTARPRQPRR